jgi:hypothetical protein
VNFCGRALSSLGDECSHPRGCSADHAYPESESPQVGWLDARVTPEMREERNERVGFGINILGR